MERSWSRILKMEAIFFPKRQLTFTGLQGVVPQKTKALHNHRFGKLNCSKLVVENRS
jgi:hypothetical protein